jgi:hypothetical protein
MPQTEIDCCQSCCAPLLQAAAAMAVGVGSFCDPLEMQGLSHYLEHKSK